MAGIQEGVVADIVRRVGHGGFRMLAPFIAAGRRGATLAFKKEVLEEVDLTEYVFTSSMANGGSMYRPFLLRCVNEGNAMACYVEGLRMLSRCGPSAYGFSLLEKAGRSIANATFALGVFKILTGDYETGNDTLGKLFSSVHTLEAEIQIGDFVMAAIATQGTEKQGMYAAPGIKYKSIPSCIYLYCAVDNVCENCYAFWYVHKVAALC